LIRIHDEVHGEKRSKNWAISAAQVGWDVLGLVGNIFSILTLKRAIGCLSGIWGADPNGTHVTRKVEK
jgi:hypothetical protein